MLGGTFFVVCLLLNSLFLRFLKVQLVIASAAAILLHFYVEKHPRYFLFSVLTHSWHFPLLIFGFLNAKYIYCTLFFCAKLRNINPTFFLTSIRLNILWGTFFLLGVLLTKLFLPLFAVKNIITLGVLIFLHFNPAKHYS